ncbi:MAG: hypothetical protein N2512_00170, partial [Armatimonadetes bacterium]|nr:hypothetical protein [Armatimonadota bacterium]
IVGNNAAEPLAVDGVTLLDKEGAPVAESEESLLVEAATRVRFPIGQPIIITGRTVHRLEAGRGEVSLVFLADNLAAAETLTRLSFHSISLLSRDALGQPVALVVSPERGAELHLGRSSQVWVKRILLDERRAELDFDRFGRVQGYDTVEDYLVEAVSLADAPVELQIVEYLASAWELKASPPPEKILPGEAVMRLRLDPAKPVRFSYTIVKHSGSRASR